MFRTILAVSLMTSYLSAQTQVDLRTQTKGVDFQAAPFTRPLKTVALLPATCTTNEVLLLTSAPAGSNIYVCLTTDNWVPEGGTSGAVTVQNGGASVGAKGTQNFIAGPGLVNAVTDLGTKINIQQGLDTSIVLTRERLQSGQSLLCKSASASATAYTCQMNPTLTGYTPGMVVYWEPDVNGNGTAATLNIDILGALTLVRADGVSTLGTGEIVAGELYAVWYDGNAMRLLSTGGSQSAGGGSFVSTGAGGTTAVTATSEWHSPLAFCSGPSAATLIWNMPPASSVAAPAGGCSGTNVNDAYGAFPNTGTTSLQTSLTLPQTLTGKADVYISYSTSTSSGTFSPALDITCTPVDGSSYNDPAFTAGNFFVPGSLTSPAIANSIATMSAQGLSWPAGCVAGSRAHLRLSRTDSTGSAGTVAVNEVVLVIRRAI